MEGNVKAMQTDCEEGWVLGVSVRCTDPSQLESIVTPGHHLQTHAVSALQMLDSSGSSSDFSTCQSSILQSCIRPW